MSDQDLEIQRIIVTGTPIDGFTYIGPFDSFESAESYADHIGVMGDWWITTLQPPVQSDSLPRHYPGAAIPIPEVPYTHVRKVGGEHVTVTGHVNGITIFDSEDEQDEELLDVVFDELFEPIAWQATHIDEHGNTVRFVERTPNLWLVESEDGARFTVNPFDWQPILTQDQPVPGTTDLAERVNWLHCNVQELEARGIELPMGDYTDVYGIIEDAREALS